MARFSVYLVLLLVSGAAVVNGVASDPGYVLVAWGSWQVETSVWLALGTLCISLGVVWLLQRALSSTLHVPAVLTRWMGGRSDRGAQQHAEKGLVAFFEGRWEAAERALRKNLPADQRRLLQSLFAVLATHRRGHRERALALLDQLESEHAVPQDLVSMVRAECHIEANEWPLAARSLDALSPAATATPRAQKLRAELAYARGDWLTVIELLPALRAVYLLSEGVLTVWEKAAWAGAMTQDDLSASALWSLWKRAPETQKSLGSGLWSTLIDRLRLQSEWGALTKALQGRFDQYCEPASLAAIAVLPRDHAKKLKKPMKRWVSEDPQSGGYAALAMIAQHDNDPDESEAMWRKACECEPSVEAVQRWAKWCREQGNQDQAAVLEADAIALLQQ
jgi:HemY protein